MPKPALGGQPCTSLAHAPSGEMCTQRPWPLPTSPKQLTLRLAPLAIAVRARALAIHCSVACRPTAPPLVLVSEAGPGGSWLDRSLTPKGQGCWGVAPSLIPQRPGDRVTTHRRDALTRARLLRSGDLPPVDVPAVEEEARRDLGRARAEALHDRKPAQCRLQALLLRHASRSPAAPPGGRPTAAGAARSSGPPRRRRAGAKHTSARSLRPPNGGRVWHTPAETRGRPGAWPRWSTRPRLAAGSHAPSRCPPGPHAGPSPGSRLPAR